MKKGISSDPRYDAVGSSSLREDFYNAYVRKLASTSAQLESAEDSAARKLQERKAREEASLKERQTRINQQQQQVQKDMT